MTVSFKQLFHWSGRAPLEHMHMSAQIPSAVGGPSLVFQIQLWEGEERKVTLIYLFWKLNFRWMSVLVHMGYKDSTLLSFHRETVKNLKALQLSVCDSLSQFSSPQNELYLSPVWLTRSMKTVHSLSKYLLRRLFGELGIQQRDPCGPCNSVRRK